jgi:hypothetical protein
MVVTATVRCCRYRTLFVAALAWMMSSSCWAAIVGDVRARNVAQVDHQDNRRQIRSAASASVNQNRLDFEAKHQHVVVADSFTFSAETGATFDYAVEIDVVAERSEAWQLDLSTLLHGALLGRADVGPDTDNEFSETNIRSFTFSDRVPNGRRLRGDLRATGSGWSAISGLGADVTEMVADSKQAVYFGVGSQTIKLNFGWESRARSVQNEASVRFGLKHDLDDEGFGDIGEKVEYASSANINEDGYFVEGTLRPMGKIFGVGIFGEAFRIRHENGAGLKIKDFIGHIYGTHSLTVGRSQDIFGVANLRGGGFGGSFLIPWMYSVDPSTGVGTLGTRLSLAEAGTVKGIELIPNGSTEELWVVNDTASGDRLHRVDSSGNSVFQVPLLLNGSSTLLKDLAYEKSTDTLYGWDDAHALVKIDRATGTVTDDTLFSLGNFIDGIAFDPGNGILYGAGPTGLFSINTQTEAKALIGTSSDYQTIGDIVIIDDRAFKSNMVYTPGSGNIILDSQGRNLTSVELVANGIEFQLENFVAPPIGETILSPNSISVSGLDSSLPLDLGAILPPGLTADQLASQLVFRYALGVAQCKMATQCSLALFLSQAL